jgi:hypothetical protein
LESLKGRDKAGDLSAKEPIIFKWASEKMDVARYGLMWLRIRIRS